MAPDANISLIVPADQPPDASIEGVEVNVLREGDDCFVVEVAVHRTMSK
ncbi:MAG: hypothetical protein ACK5KM_16065 [Hyphomicrobiaceae bacterium]